MKIRWQDWTTLVLGAWLMFSPWQMGYTLNKAAAINACGIGAALIAFNLMSVWRLIDDGQDILNIVMGVWLIFSPFALDFAASRGPAINAIAIGVLIAVLSVWEMFASVKAGKK